MGFFDSLFSSDTLGAVADVAAVALAPETGGASLAMSPGTWGAIGDLGSAAIGGGLSYMGQSSANSANQQIANMTTQANAAEAQKNRDWQEKMRSTQYQTAVKDMQAAGLNPMLAYSQGGAGTPSGAVGYAAQAAPMQNAMQGVGHAVSSVKPSELALRGAQVRNYLEQNKQIQAVTAESESRTRLNDSNDLKTIADMFKSVAEIEYVKQMTKTSSAQAGYHGAAAAGIEAQRAKDRAIQPLFDAAGSIVNSIGLKEKVQQLFSPSSYNFGVKK